MDSKQIQTCSIIWNCSSYKAGAFRCKISPRTKHNWHSTIGFLILFFRKEYILFSNVYISVNTIFKSCYLFFGWEISHPLSTHVYWCIQNVYRCTRAYRGEGERGITPKSVQVHTGGMGRAVSSLMCTYALTYNYKQLQGVLSLPSLKGGVFVYIRISTKHRHLIFLKEFLTQMFV